MKLTPNSFFPGLDFKEINLNDFLKEKQLDYTNPAQIQNELDNLKYLTYGGYGENRKDIAKGSYLDETKNYIHLGIDINVPKGTPIYIPFYCKLVGFLQDTDTDVGWGQRIILKKDRSRNDFLLVLAHLDPKYICNFNCGILKQQLLGFVGTWPTNGNTFQHLHIQCIKQENINDFDGYGKKRDLKNNPNPFEIEW